MNDRELFEQISKKLSALLAMLFSKTMSDMTTTDGERFLRRFELTNQEVADILGTTKRSIEVMKSKDKKKK